MNSVCLLFVCGLSDVLIYEGVELRMVMGSDNMGDFCANLLLGVVRYDICLFLEKRVFVNDGVVCFDNGWVLMYYW